MDKYKNTNPSFSERASDLVSNMTLEEKISQTLYMTDAVPRLGMDKYNWWSECLHGVARAGIATVFPQTIGMAAAFDTELMYKTADVISTEARAKHHEAKRNGETGSYKGLTFFSPNVNIFRDPRWGRGQETFGEDPHLTSRLGVEYCKGLQGDDDKYLKVLAVPKHFAVHSGPENMRHEFDAVVSKKDMYETYLPAFKACVTEARAYGIMGAYNRVNGEPCCSDNYLLNEVLRGDWGFDGVVVSDAGAVEDIYKGHKIANKPEQAAAMALSAGCDLNVGSMYKNLSKAIEQGIISEEILDKAVYRIVLAKLKLGMYDDENDVCYAQIPYEANDCKAHHEVCRQMTAESIVLLQNKKLLPLKRKKIKTIAVVGPNANSVEVLLGNYNGEASISYTILDGVRLAHPNAEVIYAKGCNTNGIADESTWGEEDDSQIWEAVAAAKRADVTIIASGLNAQLEGEESPFAVLEEYAQERGIAISSMGGDKENLELPQTQVQLIKAVSEVSKKTILLNLTGSAVNLGEFIDCCDAIMQCWYPGQFGGEVIAKMIFGDYSPSGKLPITFYKDFNNLPSFSDYSMDNRTYRYYEGEPLYPFGYGLSYSRIEYYRIYLSKPVIEVGEDIEVSVSLCNKGKYDVKETVQVYLQDMDSSVQTPKYKLVAFQKVDLPHSKERSVSLTIKSEQMALINKEGASVVEKGRFSLYVGGGQPDTVTEKLYKRDCLHIGFIVE